MKKKEITLDDISKLYEKINRDNFNGKLIKVPISLVTAKRTSRLASFRSEGVNRENKRIEVSRFALKETKLSISDLLKHEMVHVLDSQNNQNDLLPHGKKFVKALEKAKVSKSFLKQSKEHWDYRNDV